MTDRKLRLGAFLQATGHHVSAWLHPDAQADAGHNIDHYKELARTAERGKLDMIFLADSPGGYAHYQDSDSFRQNAKAAHFEPVTLWAALSQVTERIGFVATSTTTYEDPFTTARKFASLDWISGGRAAWNVVTTGADVSATLMMRRAIAGPLRICQNMSVSLTTIPTARWPAPSGGRAVSPRSMRRSQSFSGPIF